METEAATPGILPQAANAVVSGFTSPLIGAGVNAAGNWLKNSWGGNKVGRNSDPYGQKPQASPTSSNGFNLPNFNQRQ
jgi:hypothetical protein